MDRDLLGYVVARRLRALLGEERFARLGRVLPRFRLEPAQALDPFTVVDAAVLQLTRQGLAIPGASLLVIGCGPTWRHTARRAPFATIPGPASTWARTPSTSPP